MTTAADTRTWHPLHHRDGASYPVRHQPPHGLTHTNWDAHHEALGMTTDQANTAYAIHEAAHAIAALVGGGHVYHARINIPWRAGPSGAGGVDVHRLTGLHHVATFFASGERAENRWLHEHGLWTTRRAIAIEISANTDRQTFLRHCPHFGFGDTERDYLTAHDAADQVIDRHWDEIHTVAAALLEHKALTGDDIAALIDLPGQAR